MKYEPLFVEILTSVILKQGGGGGGASWCVSKYWLLLLCLNEHVHCNAIIGGRVCLT